MLGKIFVYEAATKFSVDAPTTAVKGAPLTVTVTAVGQNGTTDGLYSGTVHFTVSDTAVGVKVPADYSFTSADLGTHAFNGSVTLQTGSPSPGTPQTITVTDAAGLTGTATIHVIVCPPGTSCAPAPPTGLNATVQ